MSRFIFVALVVVALALAEVVYYLVRYLSEKQEEQLSRRLRSIGETDASGVGGPSILRKRRLASSPTLNDFLAQFPAMEKLEKSLEQGDMDMSVAQLLVYCVGLFFVGSIVGLFLRTPLFALITGPMFALLPFFFIARSKTQRAKHLSEQLPDALEMMARAIKAGHALPSSFKLVAQECPPPVAVEFAKAYEQQHLGLSFEESVTGMTERVPGNLDLRLFAVSIMVQKETGGNLVEVLENISNTMRERFKFYSKLSALTAEGRLSGIILGSLPFAVGLLILLTNPSYLNELFTPMGFKILGFGSFMWILGVLWMRSMLKVDY